MYFSELKSLVKAKYGNQARDVQILDWTNLVLQDLSRELFETQLKEFRFVTTARYNTGTVSGTISTTTLNFIGTALTSAMTGRKIKISGHDTVYKITYSDATTATTDIALTETIAAGTAYDIFEDECLLPADFIAVKTAYRYGQYLDYNSILWDKIYNKGQVTLADPVEYTLLGTKETSYYSTGTMTIAGTTATIAGGVIPSDSTGRIFRVRGSSDEAYISAVAAGGATCTLDRSGLIANASTYDIDPAPREIMLIHPAPKDDIHIVSLLYYRRFLNVINDDDVIPFPAMYHSLIMKGVDFKFAQHQREFTMIQDAKQDFLFELENVRYINNQRKLKGRKNSKWRFSDDAQYQSYPRMFVPSGEL
jgi:hypothetical protein